MFTRETPEALRARGFEQVHDESDVGWFKRIGVPILVTPSPFGWWAPSWGLRLAHEWPEDGETETITARLVAIKLLHTRPELGLDVDALITTFRLGGSRAIRVLAGEVDDDDAQREAALALYTPPKF